MFWRRNAHSGDYINRNILFSQFAWNIAIYCCKIILLISFVNIAQFWINYIDISIAINLALCSVYQRLIYFINNSIGGSKLSSKRLSLVRWSNDKETKVSENLFFPDTLTVDALIILLLLFSSPQTKCTVCIQSYHVEWNENDETREAWKETRRKKESRVIPVRGLVNAGPIGIASFSKKSTTLVSIAVDRRVSCLRDFNINRVSFDALIFVCNDLLFSCVYRREFN